ncbi:hypothetical protein MIND_00405600 [Mycena indigotica]|uniref:Uncharacterized protein n=1 Tax=Mycena indigotica TaxID=2126181 RepID=A0A8H6T6H2_9AGAR|nr:uncharacterized protein MIND_00405600 [Mycena indigotica]KAF7310315.1 hypothetical protein MIND_00405600 [Mycena indigotica]
MQESISSPPIVSLPVEMELTIFELAALFLPKDIPKLVLVAKRVREWVEPLLYRTLVFTSEDCPALAELPSCDWDEFTEMVATKGRDFLGRAVRNVLAPRFTDADVRAVVDACSGLENLYLIWGSFWQHCLVRTHAPNESHASLPSPRPVLKLRRLYGQLEYLVDVDRTDFATTPLFAHVTHLELFSDPFESDTLDDAVRGYERVLAMPALTHLAIGSNGDDFRAGVYEELLGGSASTQLCLFVVLLDGVALIESITPPRALTRDPRFVVNRPTDVRKSAADWQYGCLRAEDYWARAERFVAQRRAGEIPENEYFLPSSSSH